MSRLLGVAVSVVGLVALSWVPAGNGIKGSVRDVDGKPVAGAWIEARQVAHATLDPSDFKGEPAQGIRSAADGAYSLRDLGHGTWIVTAVGSATPRTDDEMKALVRASAKGTLPGGVAVTRLVRHYQDDSARVEALDLGLTSAAEQSLHGRLVGVFDPEHFHYEVQCSHPRTNYNPPGADSNNISVTVTGGGEPVVSVSASPPVFSAVPTADGQFDFGSFAVDEHDTITVEAFPLAQDDWGFRHTTFAGPVAKLVQGAHGVEVPLPGLRVVTLRAVGLPDGAIGRQPEYTIWDEQGTFSGYPGPRAQATTETRRVILPIGSYLVRAAAGGEESSIVPLRVEAAGELPDVVLELLPLPHNEVTLVDEAGQPIADAWIYIGTDATVGFRNPFPLFVVTDGTGKISNMSLSPGRYHAQLVDEQGSHEEWRVSFDFEVASPKSTVTVPLSSKVKTYP